MSAGFLLREVLFLSMLFLFFFAEIYFAIDFAECGNNVLLLSNTSSLSFFSLFPFFFSSADEDLTRRRILSALLSVLVCLRTTVCGVFHHLFSSPNADHLHVRTQHLNIAPQQRCALKAHENRASKLETCHSGSAQASEGGRHRGGVCERDFRRVPKEKPILLRSSGPRGQQAGPCLVDPGAVLSLSLIHI